MSEETLDSSPQTVGRGSMIDPNIKTALEMEQAPAKKEEQAAPVNDGSENEESEESAPSEEEQEEQPKKSKGGFQRRVDKLTKEKSDLARRLEAAERALADKQEPKKEEAAPKPTNDEIKAPNPDEFDSYADYIKAVARHEAKVERLEYENKQRELDNKRKATEAANEFKKKLDAAKAKHEDFDDVFDPDLPISEAMHVAIMDSEVAGDLAYYLSKNPKEASEIAGLPPLKAVKRLALIESKLSIEPSAEEESAPEPKKVSGAPKPITPIKKGSGGSTKSPEDMSFSEYKAWRAQKYGKR